MAITDKEYLAKGQRGIVHTAMYKGKKVVVKEVNPTSDIDTIANEAEILQIVNKRGIGPTFFAYKDGQLIREFIEGSEFLIWAKTASPAELKTALFDLLDQCRTLDTLLLSKTELTHPQKHILMRNNLPVQIDWERTQRTPTPKNVTQIVQWITGRHVTAVLPTQLDREVLSTLAKKYKNEYSDSAFVTIRREVERAW